jgi:hypothetical protein
MGFEKMYSGTRKDQDRPRNENDFYPTPPFAVHALLKAEGVFEVPWWKSIGVWEPACGKGYMARELRRHNMLRVRATDLYEYPIRTVDVGDYEFGVDFLNAPKEYFDRTGWIITNPPYTKNQAELFARKAIEEKVSCALLCRTMFLESARRLKLFREHPPYRVYQFSGRFSCQEENLLTDPMGGMVSYAWFLWGRNSSRNSKTTTELRWIDSKKAFEEWKSSFEDDAERVRWFKRVEKEEWPKGAASITIES